MSNVAQRIRNELKEKIDEKTRNSFQRFFKEKVRCYGVKTGTVGKIAKKYWNEIKGKNKKEIFELCEELYCSDYTEEAFVVSFWLPNYMDNLEQKGVFRTYSAMLEVRAKVAQHYPSEEIAVMGDGFVVLLSLLKKLSQPEMIGFIDKLMDLPLGVNLRAAKPVGAMGLLSAKGKTETRQGLGVALELTKALGKLKAD
jgi:hypothetical protein